MKEIYSKKNRIAQDKYYTKPEVADICFKKLMEWFNKYELINPVIIEPSAGDGKMMDAVKDLEVIGYDLFPEREDIKTNDFLKNPDIFVKERDNIMFGNPPFGSRGAFVKIFIKEGLKNCPFIGLIVPNSFLKVKKNVNNKEYQILDIVALDSKGYTLLEEDYEVNTHFVIFANNQDKFEPIKEIIIEEKVEPTQKPNVLNFKEKLKDWVVFDLKLKIEEVINGSTEPTIQNFNYLKKELSLDSVEWKEFIVEDLFYFITNTQIAARDFIPGNTPIIQASSLNNGITDYIGNNLKTAKNFITTALTGEPGITFYHNYTGIPSSRVIGMKLHNKEMNDYEGIFMTTCIEKLKPKYSYGKSLSQTRLKSEKIWLPIDSDGKPNYQFMEDYIKSMPYSEILEKVLKAI